MKKLLLTLTALSTTGLGMAAVANATTKDGFYVRPSAELIFVDKNFTKRFASTGAGVGGGAGFAWGYQFRGFQFDLETSYQYYGGAGTIDQTTGARTVAMLSAIETYQQTLRTGASQQAATQTAINAFNTVVAVPGTGDVTTTVKSAEGFFPITLGVNYVIPLGTKKITLTPGFATGLFIHTVSRDITRVLTVLTNKTTTLTKDETTEYKAVVVPRLSLDWNISDNASLSLAAKFYIVPGGYSDNYSEAARVVDRVIPTQLTQANFAQNFGALGLTPAYNLQDQLFWYGGLNLAFQYTF